MESRRFPPKGVHVRQAVELVSQQNVSDHWIPRFLDRHPQVAAKFISPMEPNRLEATSPYVVRDRFAKLGRPMKRKNIQEPDVYNRVKKGFLMGLAEIMTAICSYEGRSKFKFPGDENRAL